MIIRVLLVDDHTAALDMLEMLLSDFSYISVVGKETNPIRALNMVLDEDARIDVVFVDIEMPELSGARFAAKVKGKVFTVFTTGHPDYGPDAIENDVIGYLMKPIDRDKLIDVLGRIKAKILSRQTPALPSSPQEIFINGSGKGTRVKIRAFEVVFVEAARSYSILHMNNNQQVITTHNLSEMEERLPFPHFVRIHKSYLINFNFIHSIDTLDVTMENGKQLPFGSTYKEKFKLAFKLRGHKN
ncbi:LytTR family DNA-binding domain-containing protein [Sphingobacterium sp. UME9]|uniref:LytR/AlgR family response regulator transcription factor n=1 Tax=Sphingobacterium TaxID=28453 RepID=UPI0016015F2E|nr:LytTR family DNA-binding domain-containing protein [Sphingobacterium sp. UME9]MBB1642751.1 hypothetical protein [Sphingobacterium sp. UME9]